MMSDANETINRTWIAGLNRTSNDSLSEQAVAKPLSQWTPDRQGQAAAKPAFGNQ